MATETDYARKCQQLDVLIDLLEGENKRLREMIVYCKECARHNRNDCPLLPVRGYARGHEYDEQFCCFGIRRTTE